jgi:hypothetical protein
VVSNQNPIIPNVKSYTISCWFKVTDQKAGGLFSMGFGFNNSSLYGLTASTSGNNNVNGFHFISNAVPLPNIANTYSGFTVNSWQHAVLTYDSIKTRLYMNGKLADSSVAKQTIPVSSSFACNIGSIIDYFGKNKYFVGLLDDIAIYRRALGESEVKQIYNSNINNSINIRSLVNKCSVYPNPVSDFIFIESDPALIKAKYAIYDNFGKVIYSGEIDSEKTTIESGKLTPGIYMLKIGNGIHNPMKIIKY